MDTEAVVFVYTGPGGDVVPRDVVCLRVDPSVMSIPANAFFCCKKLTEVELCEGIVEIGAESFAHCDMTKINIPNSTRKINKYAFYYSLQLVLFVSTMALKVLENTHLLAVSSPTLEFRPSSL